MTRKVSYIPIQMTDPDGKSHPVNPTAQPTLESMGWTVGIGKTTAAAQRKRAKKDELNDLVHVDKVRRKKLLDLKIDSFHKVSAVSVEDLVEHIDVSEEIAEEIIIDAEKLAEA